MRRKKLWNKPVNMALIEIQDPKSKSWSLRSCKLPASFIRDTWSTDLERDRTNLSRTLSQDNSVHFRALKRGRWWWILPPSKGHDIGPREVLVFSERKECKYRNWNIHPALQVMIKNTHCRNEFKWSLFVWYSSQQKEQMKRRNERQNFDFRLVEFGGAQYWERHTRFLSNFVRCEWRKRGIFWHSVWSA